MISFVENSAFRSRERTATVEVMLSPRMEKKMACAGLDVGTGALKLACPNPDGSVKTVALRNVFYDVPGDQDSREMLKRVKAPVMEVGGKTFLAGNEAFDLAKIFGKELRRPMQSGVINASGDNADGVAMIGALIERVLKEAGEPGVCSYSCPADPVDVELDSVLHRTLIESKLRQLGWKPKMVLEGHAVALAELGNEDFTGMAISMGAGMQNVAVCFKSLPVIAFSSCRSGDFIDRKAAQRLGVATPRVSAVKEDAGFDLRTPSTLEQITVAAYYKEVIQYALEHVKRRFDVGRDLPRFESPIPVVLAGGTSRVKGVVETFKEVFERMNFPFPVKEVRLSADPIFSAAKGCLISAMIGG